MKTAGLLNKHVRCAGKRTNVRYHVIPESPL